MVQHRWLSPEAVRSWLNSVSFADKLSSHLSSPAGKKRLSSTIVQGLHLAARHLEHPRVTLLICRFWRRTLCQCPLPTALAPWCVRLLRNRASEGHLYARLAAVVTMLRQQPILMEMASQALIHQLKASTTDSAWAKAQLWIGKRLLKGDDDVEKMQRLLDKSLQSLSQQLVAMSENSVHPMRLALRRQLFRLLRRADEQGHTAKTIETLWQRLLPLLTRAGTARAIARRVQQGLLSLLQHDAKFQHAIQSVIEDQAYRLLTSSPHRERIDHYLRAQCVALLERYPHVIGAIVRESLSPEKLSTQALVRQVEEKVGQDLQWIRVNGAVVGGLVAMVLALVHRAVSAMGG